MATPTKHMFSYINRSIREDGMNLQEAILQAVEDVNRQLPSYSRIANFEFMFKEFEKTPKRSIKRYLYQ
jgi:long-chain acyl-CoA synthetase